MSDKVKISGDEPVEELVKAYPEAVGFLAERGVVCIRCGEPYWGTLRELMEAKGMHDQIELIVADLNKHLKTARL